MSVDNVQLEFVIVSCLLCFFSINPWPQKCKSKRVLGVDVDERKNSLDREATSHTHAIVMFLFTRKDTMVSVLEREGGRMR